MRIEGERRALIEEISKEATEWRRELHRHPGTMYEETFASAFVTKKLEEWGIGYEVGLAKTGVVATIEGRGLPGAPVIAFRADIDALDIAEETGLPWASEHPGKMHACGHDGHTATVLALGKYLQETRRFAGTVRLIFQPAEEGGRGAAQMLEDGLLERFPFDEIYGFHNMPYAPAGLFTICSGYMMAATDFFEITLTGRGGHAALPQGCDDVIVAGSALLQAMQGLISRERDPVEAAVLSITNFQAGTGAANVLPAKVWLSGTVRTFQPKERERLRERMAAMIEHVAAMYRMEAAFEYKVVTDSVYNHEESVGYCRESVAKLFGESSLKVQAPVMVGEDFGSFLEQRPGAFIFLGQADGGPEAAHSQGVHTSRYDFNDAVIPLAVEYFAELAETRGGWD